jgi:hypothetical protein
MNKPIQHKHPLFKIANDAPVDLPTPSTITGRWNFGLLLGMCLVAQIVTGLLLAIHYCQNTDAAFDRVRHICRDVNYGWLLRTLHVNGASIFFVFTFIPDKIYIMDHTTSHTHDPCVVILFLTKATAFIGYVLPWRRIPFCGATVITNLLSAIPYVGNEIVQWVWGGFTVDNATLTQFFALYFLIPLVIAGIVLIHLLFLHQTVKQPIRTKQKYRQNPLPLLLYSKTHFRIRNHNHNTNSTDPKAGRTRDDKIVVVAVPDIGGTGISCNFMARQYTRPTRQSNWDDQRHVGGMPAIPSINSPTFRPSCYLRRVVRQLASFKADRKRGLAVRTSALRTGLSIKRAETLHQLTLRATIAILSICVYGRSGFYWWGKRQKFYRRMYDQPNRILHPNSPRQLHTSTPTCNTSSHPTTIILPFFIRNSTINSQ